MTHCRVGSGMNPLCGPAGGCAARPGGRGPRTNMCLRRASRGKGFSSMTDSDSAAMTAILDIDGTLVDTNYHHVISWARAFARHDITVPLWQIHRHIGMGGDQVVIALCGEEVDERLGDEIREAEGE